MVIGILAVLVAIAIPAYSRFFGAGQDEANAAELSHVQDAMHAMMADYRITAVDTPDNGATGDFGNYPKISVKTAATLTNGIVTARGEYDYLYPGYLRSIPTNCNYTWNATGFVTQSGGGVPGAKCK